MPGDVEPLTETGDMADRLRALGEDPLASAVTGAAVGYLGQLFARDGDRLGAVMAGRAEELIGAPATVTAAVTTLADDLLAALGVRA